MTFNFILLVLVVCVIGDASSTVFESCEGGCEVPVRIESGVVCGRVRHAEDGTRYASYRAIPYGKPPTGHRRFKELEPVEPWGDRKPYHAVEDPPACPQNDFVYGRIPLQPRGQSEDCIYANVHVPYSHVPKYPGDCKTKRPLLPVLVSIHGGVFQCGSGLTDLHGPEYLMTRPVVVITFNYRINIFGFFCLYTKEIPGNQAFRDMITLLKWVKRNVRAFGGDPNNVTLLGQSGGGSSAHIVALSESSKGLFRRLVLMSGTAYPSYYTTSVAYTKNVTYTYLQLVGINSTDPADIHEQLVKMPLVRIMDANTELQYRSGMVTFNPVVEEQYPGVTRILDEDPLTLIANGRAKEYPAIISFTTKELVFAKYFLRRKNFISVLQQNPAAIVEPRLLYSLPQDEISEIVKKIYEKYFVNEQPTLDQVLEFFSKEVFIHPAFKLAQWRAAIQGASPTYFYQFSYEANYSVIKAAEWVNYTGAGHIDDLAFVFRVNSILGDYISCPRNNTDDKMKVWMVRLITDFMTCGNPLCGKLKGSWPPVSKGDIKYLDIRQPFEVTISRPTAEQRDMVQFFDSLDPEVRNITRYLDADGGL